MDAGSVSLLLECYWKEVYFRSTKFIIEHIKILKNPLTMFFFILQSLMPFFFFNLGWNWIGGKCVNKQRQTNFSTSETEVGSLTQIKSCAEKRLLRENIIYSRTLFCPMLTLFISNAVENRLAQLILLIPLTVHCS